MRLLWDSPAVPVSEERAPSLISQPGPQMAKDELLGPGVVLTAGHAQATETNWLKILKAEHR